MAFSENVTDALQRVHVATRTLAIARTVQETQRIVGHILNNGFLVDDVVTALVQRLHEAEAALIALLSAEGGSITDLANGYTLTSRLNDRRRLPRRQFVLHRMAQAPAGRRAPFVGMAS
jgi:hypothetical protein